MIWSWNQGITCEPCQMLLIIVRLIDIIIKRKIHDIRSTIKRFHDIGRKRYNVQTFH